jgi:hypothetical protein
MNTGKVYYMMTVEDINTLSDKGTISGTEEITENRIRSDQPDRFIILLCMNMVIPILADPEKSTLWNVTNMLPAKWKIQT